MGTDFVAEYMADCRTLVMSELRRIVPRASAYQNVLYNLVFDYPLREAKSLRPALCVASCRALGGALESVITSAAVIELYHNAFLIHDDVEDGSELRRDAPTLHRAHGVPVAVNVGDAMLALALEPLLDNMRLLSLGKALRILQTIARMARESAEGQALELAWIRAGHWMPTERDYVRMVHKKTSHYTFVAPMLIGGIVAGASAQQLYRLRLFASSLGVAFQIQDDLLNLTSSEDVLGKEIDGDLWEGKHTLLLIHAIRSCSETERQKALSILRKPRPRERADASYYEQIGQLADQLKKSSDLSRSGHTAIRELLQRAELGAPSKSAEDVSFLKALIVRYGAIERARAISRAWARRAQTSLQTMHWLTASVHRDFLEGMTEFVVERSH